MYIPNIHTEIQTFTHRMHIPNIHSKLLGSAAEIFFWFVFVVPWCQLDPNEVHARQNMSRNRQG